MVRCCSVAVAIFLLHAASLAKLHVLVTHTAPTGKIAGLLNLSESDFRIKAEELGLVVTESEFAIYARPKNLYNLDFMRKCMDSFNVLRGMAASGESYKKFADLTTTERQNIRTLFTDSTAMEAYGPNIMDDSTTFKLQRKANLVLTNGRRDISIRVPEKSGGEPKDFIKDMPDPAKLKEFREKVLPDVKKENYPDDLIFTFGKNELISSTKTSAIVEYANELTETLEGQRKAFVAAMAALQSALTGDKMPKQGASWLTLDDATQRYINSMKADNFVGLGFDSREAAEAFFLDARVKDFQVEPFIGIGLNMGGTTTIVLVSVKVNRNIPP